MSISGPPDGAMQYFEAKHIQAILDDAMHSLVQAMPPDPLEFLESALRHPTPPRVIVTGPPRSGKSIVAKKLAAHYDVAYVTAARGASAVDDVVAQLTDLQRAGQGWVLDGCPETRADAIRLQTHGVAPQRVFEIQLPLSVAMQRTGHDSERTEEGEADGNGSTLGQRYRMYETRRREMAAAYPRCCVAVPGTGTVDEIGDRLVKEMEGLHLS